MTRAISTIVLLVFSNAFMTMAWYGHLRLKEYAWFNKWSLAAVILFSWGIALFEYALQVPANRLGYIENGGPFSLWQLKVMQEVITLIVFALFSFFFFKNEVLKWNHLVGGLMLVGAVYFIFKK